MAAAATAAVAAMDVDMDTDTKPAVPPAPIATAAAAEPGRPSAPQQPLPAPVTLPSTPTLPSSAEPRRRNRPALSCIQCRTRKIRCDRMEPCASCLKSKIVNCTYEEARRPKPRLWRLSPTAADPGSPTSDSNANFPRFTATNAAFAYRPDAPAPPPAAGLQYASSAASLPGLRSSDAGSVASSPAHHPDSTGTAAQTTGSTAALEDRVRQLERQLADALKRQNACSPSPTLPAHSQGGAQGAITQGLLAKSPCEGGAHWPARDRLKFFPLIMGLAERVESDRNSRAFYLLHECKSLGKSIKLRTQRALLNSSFELGSSGLPEPTVRLLVEAYFRTFESVYRILHRPTFWREYGQYWDRPSAASEAFVIQLKLCVAIGACFRDDLAVHRRSLAAKWIYEAKVWLVSPEETALVSFEGLQAMCLLHLARETCGVGDDLGWVSAGSILTIAMQMGLHRDPENLSNMSTLDAEMRRRLWATVLEMALQSSMDSGGPPLVTVSDFDTRQPSNFDDDQLSNNERPAVPRPLSTFTETSVQLALLRSAPTRLAIAQYVSQFHTSASYEVTLKWNSELTNVCRALSATLQPSYDPAGIIPKRLSLFQLRLAEHMVHRFFLALNHPWLAQNDPAYYFARKMCVETALKLYRAIAAGSPAGDSGTASQTDDFTRLATCGYGAFRSVPMLAVRTICLELLWQVQEDQSFRQTMDIDQHQLERTGPGSEGDVSAPGSFGSGAAPRQDLFDAVKYAITWTNRRIQAGETNIKGRLFCSALLTQVHSLQRGAGDVEVERLVQSVINEDLEHCWHLLKDMEAAVPGPAVGPSDPRERDWEDARHSHGLKSIFNSNDVESLLHG